MYHKTAFCFPYAAH